MSRNISSTFVPSGPLSLEFMSDRKTFIRHETPCNKNCSWLKDWRGRKVLVASYTTRWKYTVSTLFLRKKQPVEAGQLTQRTISDYVNLEWQMLGVLWTIAAESEPDFRFWQITRHIDIHTHCVFRFKVCADRTKLSLPSSKTWLTKLMQTQRGEENVRAIHRSPHLPIQF